MLGKYKILLLQIGSLLASIILFIVLQKFYLDRFSQSFQTYLGATRPSVTNPNFTSEMMQNFIVASFGNDSLIQTFIFPLFVAVGVLIFIVFLLSNRISELNKEVKEIKEKLNV